MDAISTTVFHKDSLTMLHKAFSAVVEEFIAILDSDNPILSSRDALDRLNSVEQDQWKWIRLKFMEDSYHGYMKDGFKADEVTDPAKLILDLIAYMDGLKGGVHKKLEELYNKEVTLKKELKQLQEQMAESQEELLDIRFKHSQDRKELGTIRGQISHLQQVIDEKTRRITELQREGTVQLWEREKTRILKESKEKEEKLEKRVKELQQEKSSLQQKMSHADDRYKIEKMKNELHLKPYGDPLAEELDKLKQHKFVMEKDLRSLDTELHNQQKYIIGISQGIQHDFCDLRSHIGGIELLASLHREMDTFQQRISKITEATKTGKLGSIRADLPDHYLASDKDVVNVPFKKLSLGYGVRLTPLPQRKKIEENGTNGNAKVENSTGEQTPSKNNKKPQNEHPVLVDPTSNIINMIAVLRNFPHMTQDFVKEHWDQFRHFDANGDGSLDLAEVMTAMNSTIGYQFTASQIKEAMLEVDKDDSETIDFYEYLKVSDMLLKRAGRSEVFRSNFTQKQNRNMSKLCTVQ